MDELEELFPDDLTPTQQEAGPHLPEPGVAAPRQLVKAVMRVYYELGGDTWLLEQAKNDPAEYLKMLKAILPRDHLIPKDIDFQLNVIQSFQQGDKGAEPIVVEAHADNDTT